MKLTTWLAAVGGLFLSACGNIVGGPCTTTGDCPNQVCLQGTNTPGGYCSKQCTEGQDSTCPAGSTCVRNGIRDGIPGCYKTCKADGDCRAGYSCKSGQNGDPNLICVGPQGL